MEPLSAPKRNSGCGPSPVTRTVTAPRGRGSPPGPAAARPDRTLGEIPTGPREERERRRE